VLDIWEGVAGGHYERRTVQVVRADTGETVDAVVYVRSRSARASADARIPQSSSGRQGSSAGRLLGAAQRHSTLELGRRPTPGRPVSLRCRAGRRPVDLRHFRLRARNELDHDAVGIVQENLLHGRAGTS